MDREEELVEARKLLWELHRLGGPNPAALSPEEIVSRYRKLLADEQARGSRLDQASPGPA